jgi:hypothetical protein
MEKVKIKRYVAQMIFSVVCFLQRHISSDVYRKYFRKRGREDLTIGWTNKWAGRKYRRKEGRK